MIYCFEPNCDPCVLDSVLEWSWTRPDVDLWRGRADQPGQYRFDWRISVSGVRETEFLVRFAGQLEFWAEPDYATVA